MKMRQILFIFGTRPEAIKMAPIIKECSLHKSVQAKVCITGQHKEMLQQVLDFFEISPDYSLSLMQPNQTLYDISANVLKGIEKVLDEFVPDIILVQGDTTTAMVASLAGYYKKIKVGHVEAGLRSGDIYSPFPEEVNRKIISTISTFHFAPTEAAKANLLGENVKKNVFVTGNTVIDALLWGVEKVRNNKELEKLFPFLDPLKKLILVTGHRRESFGEPFQEICDALLQIARETSNLEIIYPVHLNPNVQEVVHKTLAKQKNIHLTKPVDYPTLLWIMNRSYFVITDSGGIQEEAPSLGKPVLVMRDVTERMEGVEAGTALLVGTKKESIVNAAKLLINDPKAYEMMAKAVNPYGNGKSASQIVTLLLNHL